MPSSRPPLSVDEVGLSTQNNIPWLCPCGTVVLSVSDSTSLIVLTKPNRVRTLTIPDDTAYVTQYMNAIFAVPLNSEDRYELPI